jgi:hypothetical protein
MNAMGAAMTDSFRAQLVVPEQRQLFDYWRELAGSNPVPDRKNFSPIKLPRLLPGISLIDVAERIEDSRVRLAGTKLREIYDREITGLTVTEIPCPTRQDYWIAAYRRTIDEAMPTQGVVRGPLVHKEHVVQYWMKLPFRTVDDRVRMVLCYDHFVPASEIMQDAEQPIRVAS